LFALRRQLLDSSNKDGDIITIAQYRRFVLNFPLGKDSTNQSWVKVISTQEAEQFNLVDGLMPRHNQSYLLGSAVSLIDGISGQYAQVHFFRDILRFTSVLIDSEILSDNEANAFLNQKIFIPSPSCGSFTIELFIELFGQLEHAARVFWDNGYKVYDHPYQGRVCSFLLERLNSYLLLKHLLAKNLNLGSLLGHTTLVSNNLVIPVGLTSND
jgi:hypothetical protein